MMLKRLRKRIEGFNRYMNYLSRVKARKVLLQSSDRMLHDAGFSRELLEQGVHAWPWRYADIDMPLPPLRAARPAHDQASDADTSSTPLYDLRLTRKPRARTLLDTQEKAKRVA